MIVYRVIFGLFWGTWGQPGPLLFAIIFGIALIVLYPRRGELMPSPGMMSDSKPMAAAR